MKLQLEILTIRQSTGAQPKWLLGLLAIIAWLAVPTCKVAAQANCMQPAGFTFRQVTLSSGATISYIDSGRGLPIILIHGLGGNAGHWQMNIGPLAAAGYRVIAVNLPGYGGTAAPEGITGTSSLTTYAGTINELAAHLGLKKAVLLGHSMGGQVALLLALQKPHWPQALILAAPAGLEVFTAAEAAMLRQFATPAYFEQQDSAAIRQAFLRNFYQLPPTAEKLVAERIAQKQCAAFKAYCQTISQGVEGMLASPVADRLQQLELPVLIIAGANDALIPNKLLHPKLTMSQLLEQAGSRIGGLEVSVLGEAGHMVQWEAAAEFNQTCIQFLKR